MRDSPPPPEEFIRELTGLQIAEAQLECTVLQCGGPRRLTAFLNLSVPEAMLWADQCLR